MGGCCKAGIPTNIGCNKNMKIDNNYGIEPSLSRFQYPGELYSGDHYLDAMHYSIHSHWNLKMPDIGEWVHNFRLKANTKIKEMKIFKKQTIEIPVEGSKKKAKREVTICVLIDNDEEVRAGYSIRMLSDKTIEDKSERIAEGRARKDKTNMVDMECGRGMDKKFILYSIADSLFIGLERGSIKIKGIR